MEELYQGILTLKRDIRNDFPFHAENSRDTYMNKYNNYKSIVDGLNDPKSLLIKLKEASENLSSQSRLNFPAIMMVSIYFALIAIVAYLFKDDHGMILIFLVFITAMYIISIPKDTPMSPEERTLLTVNKLIVYLEHNNVSDKEKEVLNYHLEKVKLYL